MKIATPRCCAQFAHSSSNARRLRQIFLSRLGLAFASGQRDAIEKMVDASGVDAKIALAVARLRAHLDQASAVGSRPYLNYDIILKMEQPRSRNGLERVAGWIGVGDLPGRHRLRNFFHPVERRC